MTVPVSTTFHAHTTGGDHSKVFNFTGPRSRKWARDRKSKRGITALLPQEPQKEVTAEAMPPVAPTSAPPAKPIAQRPVIATNPVPPQATELAKPAPVAGKTSVAAASGNEFGADFWKHSGEEAQKPWNWEPWTTMGEEGATEEDFTPNTGFGDAQTSQRLMPILKKLKGNPALMRAFMEANSRANEVARGVAEGGGDPAESGLSRLTKRFFNPSGAVADPQMLARLYERAIGESRESIMESLVQGGMTEPTAQVHAKRMAAQAVGTPQQFAARVSGQVHANGGPGGLALSDVAPFFLYGGAPVALGLKGLEIAKSPAMGALFGNEQDREIMRQKKETRLQNDSAEGRRSWGVGDMAWGMGRGIFGDYTEGTSQFGAGLEKLRNMGTLQNQYQLATRQNQEEEDRKYEHAVVDSTSPLGRMPNQGSYDDAKRRELQRRQAPYQKNQGTWTQFQQANDGDYSNLATLDPLTGKTTATGSAKSFGSRVMAPKHWGSWLQDKITNSDTSHDYMMDGQDSRFDQPGAGRFSPYQAAARAAAKGEFSIDDDLSKVQLAQKGHDFNSWGALAPVDPRNLLGWKENVQGGEDPNAFRQNYEKRIGSDLRHGIGTADDIRKARRNIGANAGAVNFDEIANEWSRNRGLGSSIVGWGESQVPSDLVTAGPEASGQTKLNRAWVKSASERWSQPAEPPRPKWYQDMAQNFDKQRGYNYDDLMKYRTATIRRRYREKMRGKTWGNGLAQDEDDYGRGFHNRWNNYAAGGNANPWMILSKGMTQADRARLDPVLQEQRAGLEGATPYWRPGMQVEQLIKPSGFGWTNPLGGFSEWLGITDSRQKQKDDKMNQIINSEGYKRLRDDAGAGKLSWKDFYHDVAGNPVDAYDKTLPDLARKSRGIHSVNFVQDLAGAVQKQDEAAEAQRSPYDVAQGTW